jgi:hypothetical protein
MKMHRWRALLGNAARARMRPICTPVCLSAGTKPHWKSLKAVLEDEKRGRQVCAPSSTRILAAMRLHTVLTASLMCKWHWCLERARQGFADEALRWPDWMLAISVSAGVTNTAAVYAQLALVQQLGSWRPASALAGALFAPVSHGTCDREQQDLL